MTLEESFELIVIFFKLTNSSDISNNCHISSPPVWKIHPSGDSAFPIFNLQAHLP